MGSAIQRVGLVEVRRRVTHGILLALAAALSIAAQAASTGISVGDATATVTSGAATSLSFPLTRSGDTSYAASVAYATQDGSAVAGTDYTATSDSITIPAGTASALIKVPVTGEPGAMPDKQFSLNLLGAADIGRPPRFASQQTFATGAGPYSVISADIDGDGRPDLIFPNFSDGTFTVLINATPTGATTQSFSSPHVFVAGSGIAPTNSFPDAIAAADLNGDGRPDLVVANQNDSTVKVLFNTTIPGTGNPTFGLVNTFATGSTPTSVAIADVNGDSKPDLVVANSGDGSVSVLRNTSVPGTFTVGFATQQAFAAGDTPISVTAADINDDGRPDLVVSIFGSNTVSVLPNITGPGDATLSFDHAVVLPTGTNPTSVCAADVDGDGRRDLLVANFDDGTVSVLLNTTPLDVSTPRFASQRTFAVGVRPHLFTTDLNGDGTPDLLVANGDSSTTGSPRTISVLLNTTAPGAAKPRFAARKTFATGANPRSVIAADLNGDGRLDLVAANTLDGTVSVLRNTTPPPAAAAGFAAQQAFAAGSAPFSVTSADVNGDGRPDLVTANVGDGTVSVLLNTAVPGAATSSFAAQQIFTAGSGPRSVTAADFNGDGQPDLAVANSGESTLTLLTNTTLRGAGTPSFSLGYIVEDAGSLAVTTADLNGDGRPDLLVANGSDRTLRVRLNQTLPGQATPFFSFETPFATGSEPSSVTTADINGDGRPDVLVANEGTNFVSVLLNTTVPGATTPSFADQSTFVTGISPISITAADVNGDGRPDLLATNLDDSTVSVLLNTTVQGAATPDFAALQAFATGVNPFSISAADVDGDGRPDLLVANEGSDTVSMLLNTTAPGAATPAFRATQDFPVGSSPTSVSVADINGDGRPDLLVASDALPGTVSVLLNSQDLVGTSATPGTGLIHYVFAPQAPTNVVATAGNGSVTLSWTASPGAASYAVYLATTPGGEPDSSSAATLGTSATINGLANGTKYYFTVKATYDNTAGTGFGLASAEVSATPAAPPPAPTHVVAVAGNGEVTLSWTASPGAASYRVHKGTRPGGESASACARTTATRVSISGLTNGTTYYFTVKAYNSTAGAGRASTEVTATPR